MTDYKVKSIKKSIVNEWCMKKHYAKRMPMAVEYSFGIFKDNILQGICIFGPTAPPVPITLFGEIGKHKVRELTRLVVNDNLPKNTLSFFVSQCLKLLPKPMTLISFADSGFGHTGYIYQATNWGYYGTGGGKTIITDINGNEIHNVTLTDWIAREKLTRKNIFLKYNLSEQPAKPKHRYLYFIGNKRQIKQMKNNLKLTKLNYPKGENKRYDSSYKPTIQTEIF
tara:strand:- start:315 stop:989 length:675 start_codon:yes stop_codon:yes gene_type:complete